MAGLSYLAEIVSEPSAWVALAINQKLLSTHLTFKAMYALQPFMAHTHGAGFLVESVSQ